VGIAPTYATDRRGNFADYRMLGAERATRVTPLAKRGSEGPVAAAITKTLNHCTPRPGRITLTRLPTDSPWQELLGNEWPTVGSWTVRRYWMPAPYVTLGSTGFDDWLAAKSSNFRQQMRRSRLKLERNGATFRASSSVEEAHRDLGTFAELHLERWDKKGGSGTLTPGVVPMLEEVAEKLLPSGRFKIWNIDVGETTICSLVFLIAGNEVSWWLGGWDEGWANQRPGLVGLLYALERAFEDGAGRFDLGGGYLPYKYRFADSEELLTRTYVVMPGLLHVLRRPETLRLAVTQAASRRVSWSTKDRLRKVAGRVRRHRDVRSGES